LTRKTIEGVVRVNDDLYISVCGSYEDQEPVDEHVEEEDRVNSDDVFVGLNYHVHEGNRTYLEGILPMADQIRANTAITSLRKMKLIENIFRIATRAAPNTIGNTQ
jgi:hypothetical protein